MVADEGTGPELDPVRVLAGSRGSHRTAGMITGLGAFIYLFVVGFSAYTNATRLPGLRSSWVVTIPTDTALALLGVTATVLVAFVASLWTSAQLPETAESAAGRGRRLVLTNVTAATGMGSVSVGIAGALHGGGEHFNVVVSLATLCLGLALAYITAEIGQFIERDHGLNQSLQAMRSRTSLDRLRNARRCWLQRSRLAGSHRQRCSLLVRFRQSLGCVVAVAVLQYAAILICSDRYSLMPCLILILFGIAWSLLLGQWIAHFAALYFVRRAWSVLFMASLVQILVLAVNASVAVSVTAFFQRNAYLGSTAAAALVWSTLFGPLPLCLAGLTTAPAWWRWYRPLTEVRWGVIRAVSRHITRVSLRESEGRTGPRRHIFGFSRLRTAIRTATGVEQLAAPSALR